MIHACVAYIVPLLEQQSNMTLVIIIIEVHTLQNKEKETRTDKIGVSRDLFRTFNPCNILFIQKIKEHFIC